MEAYNGTSADLKYFFESGSDTAIHPILALVMPLGHVIGLFSFF